MKKRIVCALLTLIMLVSLVPATVITASAATMNISEAAITVLKQAEGYSTTCNSKGYTGYGTLCPEEGTHGAHKTTEKESDLALREALKPLDEAVSNFASRNGIALSQNKHDALVLFSFENGTAWTTGTGDLQAAIKSGKTDNEFLNAICWWDNSIGDDYRRMIEANMYLNGVYSSKAPDRFIRVEFEVNDPNASMSEARYQYFDVLKDKSINIVPSNNYNKFLGWYNYKTKGKQITSVTKDMDKTTLYAHWQDNSADPGANNAYYKISASKLASRVIYKEPNGKKADLPNATGTIRIDSEYLDKNGTRWGRMVEERTDPNNTNSIYTEFVGWVKIEVGASNNTSTSTGATMDVTVTVTNAYVNMRSSASITSTNVGRWEMGAQLRIINKVNGKDGFVWGQVAKSATDSTPVGWVALMYTNYDAASSQNTVSSSTATVVGTATITYNGYVNVRNAAGTDNQIVGALPNGTTVELYETKYVNGIQWGRCKTGWFCLAYADVDALVEGKDVADVGFTTYTFKGKLNDPMGVKVYKEPGTDAEKVKIKDEDRKKLGTVTITNLTADASGNTWGKFSKGWVIVTDNAGNAVDVNLNTSKFTVIAETANVRSAPSTDAAREDILVKGVEFNVNVQKQVRVVGETIWGYATKVGENAKSYNGWVNLANKNVSRDGSVLAEKLPTTSGKIATVIGTDTVKVRATGATYGKILGSLNRGTSAAVLAEKDGWYNLDIDVDGNAKTGSWVYGKYLEITEGGSAGTSGTTGAGGAVSTGMGVVANTYSGVNVRTGAGTAYAAVGKLLPGTAVEIKQVKTVGASKWGRTEKGWVCMDYITMVSNYEIADTGSTTAGGNTATGTTTSEVAIYTGIVNNDTTVYKTTSKDSDAVRQLSAGDPITMHEIVTHVEYDDKSISHDNEGETVEMKTTYWARVNDGYIYSPGDCIDLDTIDEQIYTVTGADTLNVREGAGTSFAKKDFNLEKGDQVAVTRLKIDKGGVWGFFERDDNTDGWICLTNYTTKGAVSVSDNAPQQSTQTTPPAVTPPVIGSTGNTTTGGFVNNTSGYKYTGKIINDNEVNIRATASLNAAKTTTLKNGAALVIYETTISEGMAWGRCDAGWVYLYYVDLTPVNGAVDARVVFNENTIIYTDMNCTSTTGSTYAKMAVIDIYEIVGKMARTNDGWVNTDNLL